MAAEFDVGAVEAEAGETGVQEIGGAAGQHLEAEGGQLAAQIVAFLLQPGGQAAVPGFFMVEAVGHRGLQVGGGGEDQELMRLGDHG